MKPCVFVPRRPALDRSLQNGQIGGRKNDLERSPGVQFQTPHGLRGLCRRVPVFHSIELPTAPGSQGHPQC